VETLNFVPGLGHSIASEGKKRRVVLGFRVQNGGRRGRSGDGGGLEGLTATKQSLGQAH